MTCQELLERFGGRVTVLASGWHAGYGSTAELTEWYRREKPHRDVVICLYLALQCFPTDYPVYHLSSLQRATDIIADALPPCGAAGFLLAPRLGGRLVDKLPDRGIIVDYAAGIGGWALGLFQALKAVGRTAEYTVYAYDVDPERLSIYRRGVEKYTGWRVIPRRVDLRVRTPEESPDVAVGSPPCENLSIANNKYNIERGLELVVRYLDYVDATRPKVALFEEVASLNNARRILEELLRRRGWAYEVRCLSDYGVPQICRRRVLGWRTAL